MTWTDEHLAEELNRAHANGHVANGREAIEKWWVVALLKRVRDDMQREIDKLADEIMERDELLTQIRNDMQSQIDALRQQLAEAQARADTLLQQRNYAMKSASEWGDLALLAQQQAKTQAGQWQPVEDGAFCHDIIDGFSALEVEGGQIVSIRHVSNLDGEAVQLIHDMGDLRLCRRVEPKASSE